MMVNPAKTIFNKKFNSVFQKKRECRRFMNVGVIGAGIMGIGVAQSVAQAGHNVILVDISQKILKKAEAELRKKVRFHTLFNKTKESVDSLMERITFTTDLQDVKEIDYLIENVPEVWETKKNIYLQVDRICPNHCIFLVNTSSISITKIASLTNRPEKVFGMHFMNPVPMKPTLEGIRGYHTSEETIQATTEFLATLNKEFILVNDFPGFVSNRLSHLLMNEAVFVVQDQVAEPKAVDDIFKKCFGHKMGPLETADLIGLDTVVASLDILYQSFQDPKFRVCPLLRKMVDAGLHGRKTGQGFYTYEE